MKKKPSAFRLTLVLLLHAFQLVIIVPGVPRHSRDPVSQRTAYLLVPRNLSINR